MDLVTSSIAGFPIWADEACLGEKNIKPEQVSCFTVSSQLCFLSNQHPQRCHATSLKRCLAGSQAVCDSRISFKVWGKAFLADSYSSRYLKIKQRFKAVGIRSHYLCSFLGTTSTPNELWYNIIELPYHGEMISMLIALPTESTTPLSAIIPHISTKTIGSWMTTMVAKRVQVILPK